MRKALVIIALAVMAGCVRYHDVSRDPRYPSDYVVGRTYRVLRTLVAERLGGVLTLYVPKGEPAVKGRVPRQKIVGVIEPGVSIVLTKLELEKHHEAEHVIWPHGKFVDGPFAGEGVNLFFVSQRRSDKDTLTELVFVDTDVLQSVENVPPP